MNLNKVMLAGNLTRDPELRYTAGGSAVCNFSMAMNDRWTDKASGEKKEETTFVRVTAWGKTGENIAQYFSKGKAIYIEGKLKSGSYDREDGTKVNTLDVTLREFQFVGSKSDQGGNTGGAHGHGQTADGDDIPF